MPIFLSLEVLLYVFFIFNPSSSVTKKDVFCHLEPDISSFVRLDRHITPSKAIHLHGNFEFFHATDKAWWKRVQRR